MRLLFSLWFASSATWLLVYGESLQWGFGFYLLFLIGCVIGSREEHLCLVHVLFWSSDVVGCCQPFVTEAASDVSDVDQMDIRIVEVELHQILVAEVELFCDPLFCGLGFHQIFGFWSGPWFEMWVSIRLWFLIWISCSLLTSFGIHRSFVSEVDLEGVVVRTFSCWSDFNMRASVKHELLGHGFHDELFN